MKKLLNLMLLFSLNISLAMAQSNEYTIIKSDTISETTNDAQSEKVYDVVEMPPSFPGGMAALQSYIRNNIKYPVAAKKNGIEGRVVIEFVVEKDGTLSNVKAFRSADPSLDQEAIRLVESMPKWNPGKSNGEPVNVRYTIPVTFRLQ